MGQVSRSADSAESKDGEAVARVQLIRTPQGFKPDSQHDEDLLESVKIGDVINGEFRQPRNAKHHRKAFELLHQMFDSQEQFDSFDRFYDWVKIKAGLVDLVEINEKGAVYKLQSLSFASMGQERFDKVYQQIVTVAYEDLRMEHVIQEFA